MGWQLSVGTYTGVMFGVYSQKYKDGVGHYLYLPFCFIVLDIYYD